MLLPPQVVKVVIARMAEEPELGRYQNMTTSYSRMLAGLTQQGHASSQVRRREVLAAGLHGGLHGGPGGMSALTRERRTPVAFRMTHAVRASFCWPVAFCFMNRSFAPAMSENSGSVACLIQAAMSSGPMLANLNREIFGVVAEMSGNVPVDFSGVVTSSSRCFSAEKI